MARPTPKVVKREGSAQVVEAAPSGAVEEQQHVEAEQHRLEGEQHHVEEGEQLHDEPSPDELAEAGDEEASAVEEQPAEEIKPRHKSPVICALLTLGARATRLVAKPLALPGAVEVDGHPQGVTLGRAVVLLARAGFEDEAEALVSDIARRGAWAVGRHVIAELRKAVA